MGQTARKTFTIRSTLIYPLAMLMSWKILGEDLGIRKCIGGALVLGDGIQISL